MNDSEVHSLILERVEEIEDDDVRTFLTSVLRHERDILDEPRAQYKEEYKSFVDSYIDNESLSEYDG